jgi:hypothetical protein
MGGTKPFFNFRQTLGICCAQWTSKVRWVPRSHHHRKIENSSIQNHILFEAASGFIDHRVEQGRDDIDV